MMRSHLSSKICTTSVPRNTHHSVILIQPPAYCIPMLNLTAIRIHASSDTEILSHEIPSTCVTLALLRSPPAEVLASAHAGSVKAGLVSLSNLVHLCPANQHRAVAAGVAPVLVHLLKVS